jgi:hypothetical protein
LLVLFSYLFSSLNCQPLQLLDLQHTLFRIVYAGRMVIYKNT